MTDRPPTRRAANAGYLLISPAILGGAIGFGLGSLLGVPGILVVLGVLLGLIGGFFLVHARFRDL